MLGIKLVDVDTSNACVEETGTCELCFGSMWCDNPILIFENPKGDRVAIYGYYWSWGDYFEIEIGNYLNFSDWLSKQDINWNTLTNDEENDGYLCDLVDWYREENEKEVEQSPAMVSEPFDSARGYKPRIFKNRMEELLCNF